MNLLEKIVEVRKEVEFLKKDTTSYKYKYVSGTSVLSSIRPKMDELGLILKTEVLGKHWLTDNKVCLDLQFTWVDAENKAIIAENSFCCKWITAGEDADPAKAIGKAYTYGERYYLLKFFNIPTDDDDPDKEQKKQNKKAAAENTKNFLEEVKTTAKQSFNTPDDFKTWRVDNGFPDNLKDCKEHDLINILNKLYEQFPIEEQVESAQY